MAGPAQGLAGAKPFRGLRPCLVPPLGYQIDVACVGPDSCSERSERAERSEHVWPLIVRNIWPTLAKHQSQIGQNQPKTPKVNMLKSGDVSFDFGFEWCHSTQQQDM